MISKEEKDKIIPKFLGYNEVALKDFLKKIRSKEDELLNSLNKPSLKYNKDYVSKTYDQIKTISVYEEAIEETIILKTYKVDYFNLTPIEELKLDNRTYSVLKRAGLNYVEIIQKMRKDQLLHIKNLGVKSYKNLCKMVNILD